MFRNNMFHSNESGDELVKTKARGKSKIKWFLPALIVAGITCCMVIIGVVADWQTLILGIPYVIVFGIALVLVSRGYEIF